jgi:hypothetical protein
MALVRRIRSHPSVRRTDVRALCHEPTTKGGSR